MIAPTKKVGDIELTALSDGRLATSLDVILGMDRAEAARLAGMTGDNLHIAVNAFLLKLAGKWALIDVGAGDSMGPAGLPKIFAPSALLRRRSPPSFSPTSIPIIPMASSMRPDTRFIRTRSSSCTRQKRDFGSTATKQAARTSASAATSPRRPLRRRLIVTACARCARARQWQEWRPSRCPATRRAIPDG